MIDVVAEIVIEDYVMVLYGKIDPNTYSMELNCLDRDLKTRQRCKALMSKKFDMMVSDTGAKTFCVYGVDIKSIMTVLAGDSVFKMRAGFDRLVRQEEVNQLYDAVEFSFDGIHQFFPLERFYVSKDMRRYELSKNIEPDISFNMLPNALVKVSSSFDGMIISNEIYDINIKQSKIIRIECKNALIMDNLIDLIKIIKYYFEFITKQELKIRDVCFSNKNFSACGNALLCDEILRQKTIVKPVKENSYRADKVELVKGLVGFATKFAQIKEPFLIWQKTIYNLNASELDRCFWLCQATELLCATNEILYEKSNELKAANQAYPNITNCLNAINEVYQIWELDPKQLKSVKLVRDKITHNNPKKTITQIQINNALDILETFFCSTLEKMMGITGIPHCVLLRELDI